MNFGVFKRRIDVDADIQITPLKSLYASGDKDAHIFELSLYRGAEEIDLSGASAQGYFIRADGYTVPITGAISGNVVTLTLSEGCYYVVGNFNLIIKVSTAESRKSVFWGNGYVVRSMTDAIVDEENVIPSLDELLAQIAAAESAAKAANQAASAANSAANSARQAASAADTNASSANGAANAAKAAATTATEAATKIDDMTITATGLAAGAAPTAELTEVGGHYNIALGLPKGDKGDPGATPQITVRVKTGEPGTAASVKQTGTAEAPVIELTIPRGDTGSLGSLTINGKAPDEAGKVTLTAADVGARADDWMPTAEDVGALSGTDATLTQAGKAADAKVTGDELNRLNSEKAAYSDVLTLEEIQASTNLDNKIASAESAKGLLDRLGHIKYICNVTVDANKSNVYTMPTKRRIYLFIAGHISFPNNNGIYMIIYYGDGIGCRTIPLCGTWTAQIVGDDNGNVTITADSQSAVRGDIYEFAQTD